MATENMTCLFAAIGILCSLNFKTFLSTHVPIYIVSLICYDILVTRKILIANQGPDVEIEPIR